MFMVFCCDPMNRRAVDHDYQDEFQAAEQAGFDTALISFEELTCSGNAAQAVARVPAQERDSPALYRGWMLTPDQYAGLYASLAQRGVRLLTSPDAYRHTHWLPESYAVIREYTPDTLWLPAETPDLAAEAVKALAHFGTRPVLIKDYVKSQKHAWHEACFIPCATNSAQAERVIRRFLELQGDDLQGGLVLREYVELEQLTTHSRSGMPLAREYRVFVLQGTPLLVTPYWEEGDYGEALPDLTPFFPVMRAVHSPFFTMDLARRPDGTWLIIELGDAQVAGLPEGVDVGELYRLLAETNISEVA